MASYMPSFMSKSLSTGAEAAYGQPFAFTTGIDTGGKGTKQKSGKQKKKNKKAKKAKKAKAEKPPDPPKHILKAEDRAAMKMMKMDHMEARMKAFTESTDIASLNNKLRAANAAALQKKIDIVRGYNVDDKGNENAKMRRLRKHLTYSQSPIRPDSRTWNNNQFNAFKQIYVNYYEAQLAAMRSVIVTNMREIIADAIAKKKQDLDDFYTKYPDLKPKARAKTTGS